MSKEFNKKILTEIQSRGLRPKPRRYFRYIQLLLWVGTIVSFVLGGISIGSFIFQISNPLLIPLELSLLFAVLRIGIILVSLFIGVYQVVHIDKGYKRTKKFYIGIGLFILAIFGSFLFLGNFSGSLEKTFGQQGIINRSTKHWVQPEKGLLAAELNGVSSEGYLLVTALDQSLHVVDPVYLSEQEQDIFIDFLRVRMVGYQQDEIFYPCAVSPWKIRGLGSETHPYYEKIHKGNKQFSESKRSPKDFKKVFERKTEIIRNNKC